GRRRHTRWPRDWSSDVCSSDLIGWEAAGSPTCRPGAVSLSGDERSSVTPLRRDAVLWRYWAAALPNMKPAGTVRPVAGKLPAGLLARQFLAPRSASALSLINETSAEFEGALRVFYPPTGQRIALPAIRLSAGE